MGLTAASLLCLSSVIHHEARGEPYEGQVAVAHVVLNRVRSNQFPNTVCKVVKQPKQFSWWPKKPLTNKQKTLARKVLSGQTKNPIGNAKYFSSNNVTWGKKLIRKIGRHRFF